MQHASAVGAGWPFGNQHSEVQQAFEHYYIDALAAIESHFRCVFIFSVQCYVFERLRLSPLQAS